MANLKTKTLGVYKIDFFGEKICAAFSGKSFGNTRRQDFVSCLGIHPENLVTLKQVHSANIVRVSSLNRPSDQCQADGLITQMSGIALGILTADCAPVFFYDPVRHVVGLAHAGWKGIVQEMIAKMAQAFRQNYKTSPSDLKVAIGPMIHKCCYEVGDEFQDFLGDFYEKKAGMVKGRVDLNMAIYEQLTREGISLENIFDTKICTCCSHSEFYSVRGLKATDQRILSVISLADSLDSKEK